MTPQHSSNGGTAAQVYQIRQQIAASLVGRSVRVLTQAGAIAQGVVAGALSSAGEMKVIIDRTEYSLSQVLTVTPVCFN